MELSLNQCNLQLDDGRILAYSEWGDQNGIPCFYAHGCPGSRLEGLLFDKKAKQYGIRLIAIDRPGMGNSSYQKKRTFLDYPKDVLNLADKLAIDKFGIWGWSGGGAHALACTYSIPKRKLLFVIDCAGYTNFAELSDAKSLLTTKADKWSYKLAQNSKVLFQLFFYLFYIAIKYFPSLYVKLLKKGLSKEDSKAFNHPDIIKNFVEDQKEAFKKKSKGVTIDAFIHYKDWGYKIRDIETKVIIFHGSQDKYVPFKYSLHKKEQLQHCELHELKNQGHFFPINHQDLIFSTILNEVKSTRTNESQNSED